MRGSSEVVLQKNQVLGVLFPLFSNIDIFPNKFISSYTVFCTFDISLGLKHLAEMAYSEFITLFAGWSNVFSCNKYNERLTKEEYFFRLNDKTLVKAILLVVLLLWWKLLSLG